MRPQLSAYSEKKEKSKEGTIIETVLDFQEKLVKNRILTICSQIESVMADDIMKRLLVFDKENHKPIWLYINSPGGEVISGLQIIDTMRSIKSPVYTVCTGQCASMGATILSSGDKRMILPHGRVMIHQVSSGTQGTIFNMKVAVEETERLNEITMGIIAENCGKTLEDLLSDTQTDHFMGAEESVEYGIVDSILPIAKKAVERGDNA